MNGINRINSEPPKPTTFEDLGYVQVVLCKDCKWYDEKISICDNCHLPREQTFFCADGRINEQRTVCPEIEGDRYTWFYVCGDCHGQVNWHDAVCRHCKARLDWNG